MKVLVIGANGNTATRVIRRLAESDHDPVAMIRNPSRAIVAALVVSMSVMALIIPRYIL